MTIVERVTALALPLDEVVVIGSGLLDALNLRRSRDIDLAVSQRLFCELKASGQYVLRVKHGEEVLEAEGIEIWQSWGESADMQYESLARTGVKIKGVVFCHPDIVVDHKRQRAQGKDMRDIALLEQYLSAHPNALS